MGERRPGRRIAGGDLSFELLGSWRGDGAKARCDGPEIDSLHPAPGPKKLGRLLLLCLRSRQVRRRPGMPQARPAFLLLFPRIVCTRKDQRASQRMTDGSETAFRRRLLTRGVRLRLGGMRRHGPVPGRTSSRLRRSHIMAKVTERWWRSQDVPAGSERAGERVIHGRSGWCTPVVRHLTPAIIFRSERNIQVGPSARTRTGNTTVETLRRSGRAVVLRGERGELEVDHLQLAFVLFTNSEELVDVHDHVDARHACCQLRTEYGLLELLHPGLDGVQNRGLTLPKCSSRVDAHQGYYQPWTEASCSLSGPARQLYARVIDHGSLHRSRPLEPASARPTQG